MNEFAQPKVRLRISENHKRFDMRAVLQRVSQSHVVVDGQVVGAIDRGLLVLVGVAQGDTEAEARSLADKVSQLRIFPDADGKMNLSVRDAGGAILAISQFTLLADCRKGRRPSFIMAAGPELARKLYETFCDALVSAGLRTERGIFQADMKVHLINDGPVTIVLDTNA